VVLLISRWYVGLLNDLYEAVLAEQSLEMGSNSHNVSYTKVTRRLELSRSANSRCELVTKLQVFVQTKKH